MAGTVLGWTLERAGIDWRMIDAGPAHAASRVAAGIINPVTGLRWVKTWRIEALWPETKAAYQAMAADFGVRLWRELRLRRYWKTDKEHRVLLSKCERGVLAPYVGEIDDRSAVLAPVGRVNVPALLAAARQRWVTDGRLREGQVDWAAASRQYGLVIDCTGAAARSGPFAAWDFAVSKGEVLRAAWASPDPSTILHRGQWVLPGEDGEDAWIGATHEPGRDDLQPTEAAQRSLLIAAQRLTGVELTPSAHEVGLRLAASDRRPAVGRHPDHPRLGICGALGSKGVLYAPWLAQQWAEYLCRGSAFDPEVVMTRFG